MNNFGENVSFVWSVTDLKRLEHEIADMLAEICQ